MMVLNIAKGNIPVAEDSIELRNMWHSYLFSGRELIVSTRKIINICFGLKQTISGLNEKKFKSLKKIILQDMRDVHNKALQAFLNMSQ